MRHLGIALAAGGALCLAYAGVAYTSEGEWGVYQSGEMRSGYTFAQPETQAMQDDDFANPGFLLVDEGAELWETAEGEAGKSCMDCHGDAEESMKGVATRYPAYDEASGKLINIEQRINRCRTDNMKAEAWKWESAPMLGMTVFVKNQSHGMPMTVSIDGPAKEFYEKGKAYYYQRRGQMDMACSNCHVENAGNMLRANLLSQGQPNGFPTYRLKWQKVGSLHRRFRGCNSQVRAERLGYGADDYVNLELFLSHRANGLPVETPAVRN